MIQLDCTIVAAFHLRLIRVLQDFPCVRKRLLIHAPIVITGGAACLRYGSPRRSQSTPVPPDGNTGKYSRNFRAVNAEPRKMQKSWNLLHQMETIRIASSRHSLYRRQIVDRTFAILGVTVLGFSLAVGGSGLAQTKS